MPNHVTHIAKFEGKQENIDEVFNLISTENEDENGKWTRHIDFNKIIPQPLDLFMGDLDRETQERTKGRNWYDWNRENWGTKWNSYSSKREGNTVKFNTAWASPSPVIAKLHDICKEHGVTCDIIYADEDCGNNTGHYKIGGEPAKYEEYEKYSPEAWSAYRKTHPYWDEFLVLNEDGTMSNKEEED